MNIEQIVISFSFIHCLVAITIYYLEMSITQIVTEGSLLVLIVHYFVCKKYQKVHFVVSTMLQLNLLIVALQKDYSGEIGINMICWIIVTRKSLKIHLLNRLLHVIIVISTCIFQIVFSWDEKTYAAIIHMQILISFFCCYCYYEYHKKVNQQPNNEMTQMQSSQKVINEDFHRFLTTRRSMNTICSDFVVLDVIPHGVVLLTCRQEFQHINEKAMEQLFGLTGIKPCEDNVTHLINYVLKGLLSNMNSPKNKPAETQVSKLISSISIQDNDIAWSPLEILINNQKGSSIMSSKLITSYQIAGKTRSVKFQIQKQEIPNIIIILILDVTQKVERKNQEQKYKLQHQLLNSFSHELRTPLNCSQQILENLITKCEDEFVTNQLYQILHQNDLLLCQINDILDYAAMETGNFHISHQVFTIESLFNQCKEMYEQGCRMKNINLSFKYDVYAPIRNDYMRIKQVLVNLINNSIKFCSQNGKIKIQAKQKIKNDKKLIKIKVKDDGVGITQQKLALINHVLEQHNDYFDIQTSMCIGLGLKVSNKQVKSFISGFNRLKIRSTQNHKTSVSFFIEDQLDDQDLDCQSRTSKTLYGNLSTMTNSEYKFISALKCNCSKILIVDDIPFNHQAIQIMLSGFHSNCDHAFDGLEALQLVTKRITMNKCHPYYQVILMDIDMPKMNGFDSATQIRQVLQKDNEHTHIVICSAYDNLESRKIAKQCKIEGYLPKPVQKANLLNILSQYVK